MYQLNTSYRRKKISERLIVLDSQFNLSFPKLYKEFLITFNSKKIYSTFYLDKWMRLSPSSVLQYSPSYLESKYSLNGVTELSPCSFIDILDSGYFHKTLNVLDLEIDEKLLEYKSEELLVIGTTIQNGAYFVGIGDTNYDKIYKMDFEIDSIPVYINDSIYEFLDNLILVPTEHELIRGSSQHYFEEIGLYRSKVNEKLIDEIVSNEKINYSDNWISLADYLDKSYKKLSNDQL